MRISNVYSSKLSYQWKPGSYKRKAHKKALQRMPRKTKIKGALDK